MLYFLKSAPVAAWILMGSVCYYSITLKSKKVSFDSLPLCCRILCFRRWERDSWTLVSGKLSTRWQKWKTTPIS